MSVLDFAMPGLSSDVWGTDAKLLPQHKEKIINKLHDTLTDMGYVNYDKWIKRLIIVGSLTSYQWNGKSDIDCHITSSLKDFINSELKEDITLEEAQEKLKLVMTRLNKTDRDVLADTRHPMEYYFENEVASADIQDGMYDLDKDKWIKSPRTLEKDYDITALYSNMLEEAERIVSKMDANVGKIKRNITTIEELREAIGTWDDDNRKFLKDKLEIKLEEIEKEIEKIVEPGKNIIDDRKHKAYKPFSDENIKFKFLQKYNYIALIRELQQLVEDKTPKGEIDESKIPAVKETVEKMAEEQVWYRGSNKKETRLTENYESDLSYGQGVYLTDNREVAESYGKYVIEVVPVRHLDLKRVTESQRLTIVDLFGAAQQQYIIKLLDKYGDGSEYYDGLIISGKTRGWSGNEIVIKFSDLLKIRDSKISGKNAMLVVAELEKEAKDRQWQEGIAIRQEQGPIKQEVEKLEKAFGKDVVDKYMAISVEELEKFIDEQYEQGAPQDTLDILEAIYDVRVQDYDSMEGEEENIWEGYGHGGAIEEEFKRIYDLYVRKDKAYTYEELTSMLRKIVEFYGMTMGGGVKKSVTDEQIWEAAKDAYEHRKSTLDKHKQVKKSEVSNDRLDSKCDNQDSEVGLGTYNIRKKVAVFQDDQSIWITDKGQVLTYDIHSDVFYEDGDLMPRMVRKRIEWWIDEHAGEERDERYEEDLMEYALEVVYELTDYGWIRITNMRQDFAIDVQSIGTLLKHEEILLNMLKNVSGDILLVINDGDTIEMKWKDIEEKGLSDAIEEAGRVRKSAGYAQSMWLTPNDKLLEYDMHSDIYYDEKDKKRIPQDILQEIKDYFASVDNPSGVTAQTELLNIIYKLVNYGWVRIADWVSELAIKVKDKSILSNKEHLLLPLLKNRKNITLEVGPKTVFTSWDEIKEQGLLEVLESNNKTAGKNIQVGDRVKEKLSRSVDITVPGTVAEEGTVINVDREMIKVKWDCGHEYECPIHSVVRINKKSSIWQNIRKMVGKLFKKKEANWRYREVKREPPGRTLPRLKDELSNIMQLVWNHTKRPQDDYDQALFHVGNGKQSLVKDLDNPVQILKLIDSYNARFEKVKNIKIEDLSKQAYKTHRGFWISPDDKVFYLKTDSEHYWWVMANLDIMKQYGINAKKIKEAEHLGGADVIKLLVENGWLRGNLLDKKELIITYSGYLDKDRIEKYLISEGLFDEDMNLMLDEFGASDIRTTTKEYFEGVAKQAQKKELEVKILREERWNKFVQDVIPMIVENIEMYIGDFSEDIEYVKLLEHEDRVLRGVNGMYVPSEKAIYINDDFIDDIGYTIGITLHEFLHGALGSERVGTDKIDEGYIDYLGEVLCDKPIWGKYNKEVSEYWKKFNKWRIERIPEVIIRGEGQAEAREKYEGDKIIDFFKDLKEKTKNEKRLINKRSYVKKASKDRYFRYDTGYTHTKGTTAYDVVKFEAEELGNTEILESAKPYIAQLKKQPAKDIQWFAKDEKTPSDYMSEGEESNVDEYKIPEGSKIIAEDGDNGVLVLKPVGTEWEYVEPMDKQAMGWGIRRGDRVQVNEYSKFYDDRGLKGVIVELGTGNYRDTPRVLFDMGKIDYVELKDLIRLPEKSIKADPAKLQKVQDYWQQFSDMRRGIIPAKQEDWEKVLEDKDNLLKEMYGAYLGKTAKFTPTFMSNPPGGILPSGFDSHPDMDTVYPNNYHNPYSQIPGADTEVPQTDKYVNPDVKARKNKRKKVVKKVAFYDDQSIWLSPEGETGHGVAIQAARQGKILEKEEIILPFLKNVKDIVIETHEFGEDEPSSIETSWKEINEKGLKEVLEDNRKVAELKNKRKLIKKRTKQPETTWVLQDSKHPWGFDSTFETSTDPGLYMSDGSEGQESVYQYARAPFKKLPIKLNSRKHVGVEYVK